MCVFQCYNIIQYVHSYICHVNVYLCVSECMHTTCMLLFSVGIKAMEVRSLTMSNQKSEMKAQYCGQQEMIDRIIPITDPQPSLLTDHHEEGVTKVVLIWPLCCVLYILLFPLSTPSSYLFTLLLAITYIICTCNILSWLTSFLLRTRSLNLVSGPQTTLLVMCVCSEANVVVTPNHLITEVHPMYSCKPGSGLWTRDYILMISNSGLVIKVQVP